MFLLDTPAAEPSWETGWLSDCQLLGEECCKSSDLLGVQGGKCQQLFVELNQQKVNKGVIIKHVNLLINKTDLRKSK